MNTRALVLVLATLSAHIMLSLVSYAYIASSYNSHFVFR